MNLNFTKTFASMIALGMLAVGSVHADYSPLPTPGIGFDGGPGYGGPGFDGGRCCGSDFTAHIDLIYWRAFEDGFNCGCERDNLRFDWEPGFRVGLGYNFDWNCCDLNLAIDYTRFRSSSSKHHRRHRRVESVVVADGVESVVVDSGRRHRDSGRFRVNFDNLDVTLGHEVLTSCFSFIPYVGLRASWIQQSVKGRFQEDNFDCDVLADEFAIARFHRHHRQNYWGVGPIFGIGADWGLGCGLSLFGNLSGGVLYGHFNVKRNEREIFDDVFVDGSSFSSSSSSEDFCRFGGKRNCQACQGVFDASLGFKWQRYMFCDNTLLTLTLAWEHHRYFDQNKIGEHGDLSFDGVTFGVGVDF